MSISFAQLRVRNLQNVLLNVNRGAEVVTFTPAGGTPRQITALWMDEEHPGLAPGGGGEEDRQLGWLVVARDESCAKGGIATIAQGDSMVRAGDDPDTAAWSFQNRIRHAMPESWELCFGRNRPIRFGPGR
jgi:hypothetical protein